MWPLMVLLFPMLMQAIFLQEKAMFQQPDCPALVHYLGLVKFP